ncbi:hypothetical protein HDU98_007534 [Podochytrium sp. JEL0797]|nr:hypothetical protein HDU98_007534 [Podochytrium sp. JEL0797]
MNPPDEQTKRNRRFAHLTRLFAPSNPSHPTQTSTSLDPDSFFSDASIRQRCPHLFDHYITQLTPPVERSAPFAGSVTLVERMYYDIDEREFVERVNGFGRSAEVEHGGDGDEDEEPVQEFDSDDEEGRQFYEDARRRRVIQKRIDASLESVSIERVASQINYSNQESNSPETRLEMRQELMRIMKERFLDGLESEFFDYEAVDGDEGLDDYEDVMREAQERYFDEVGGEELEGEGKRRSRKEWMDVWEGKGSVNEEEYDY